MRLLEGGSGPIDGDDGALALAAGVGKAERRAGTLQQCLGNEQPQAEATAARIGLRTSVVPYPFERADEALADLAADRITGAAVLQLDPT